MNQTNGRKPELNQNVAFEPHHLNLRVLLYVGIAVIAAGLAIHAGMWLLIKQYITDKPQPAATQPPQPRLQVAPSLDLRKKRAQAELLLNSYGWVDKQAGVIHIPIEQAMKQVAQRGLPVTEPQPREQR